MRLATFFLALAFSITSCLLVLFHVIDKREREKLEKAEIERKKEEKRKMEEFKPKEEDEDTWRHNQEMDMK